MEESRKAPFPAAQRVNLPACSPHCSFIAERQAGKLRIPILDSLVRSDSESNPSLQLQTRTLLPLGLYLLICLQNAEVMRVKSQVICRLLNGKFNINGGRARSEFALFESALTRYSQCVESALALNRTRHEGSVTCVWYCQALCVADKVQFPKEFVIIDIMLISLYR